MTPTDRPPGCRDYPCERCGRPIGVELPGGACVILDVLVVYEVTRGRCRDCGKLWKWAPDPARGDVRA